MRTLQSPLTLHTASFFRWPMWMEEDRPGRARRRRPGCRLSGIHGAPRLASMSPGSTSSGCTGAGPRRCGRRPRRRAPRLELGAHVAGEVGIGGLPFLGLGVLVDQVAQLVDDLTRRAAVERGDVGRSTRPRWFRETSSPSSALRTAVTGGLRPTTSLCMMAAFFALPVTSSYSSSDMTSMASGSSRNFTRLGIRRMVVPSSLVEKVVLLIGPYWKTKRS